MAQARLGSRTEKSVGRGEGGICYRSWIAPLVSKPSPEFESAKPAKESSRKLAHCPLPMKCNITFGSSDVASDCPARKSSLALLSSLLEPCLGCQQCRARDRQLISGEVQPNGRSQPSPGLQLKHSSPADNAGLVQLKNSARALYQDRNDTMP